MKLQRTAATPNRDWERVPLSELYSVKYGKANPGGSGSVPVVGSSGVYAWTGRPLIMHPTIVIGRKGSAGQAWLIEAPSHPADTTFYLEPQDPGRADVRFTYFALKHHQISASDDVIPSLQRREVESLLLPCPPIAEQRAIAEVLAKIQAAIELQDRIVATLKELKDATMAKLFREGLRGEPLKQTEIGEIPESWQVVQVGDLLKLSSGASRPSDMALQREEGKPFPVYGGNGVMGYSSQFLTPREAIVVGRVGAYCGSIHVCPPHSWITDNALYHRDPVSEKASLHFLAELLAHLKLNRFHRKGAQPLVTQGTVQSIRIPFPPKPEQEDIARTAGLLNEQIATAENRLATLKSLFSSMLHLLMTGQVRVTRKMIALQALEDRRKRRPKWSGKVDEKVLEEVVKRIVEAVAPEKIILFGSAARGEMGPDSDLDLLVVKACDSPREVERLVYRRLIGIGVPKDVLVVTPEHLEKHKDTIGYIYRPALREGKVIYAR